MWRYVLSIGGMVASFYMIKNREFIGDMFGDPQWAKRFGGIYVLVVVLAVFILFWCIAALTGTTHILFKPLQILIPGLQEKVDPDAF